MEGRQTGVFGHVLPDIIYLSTNSLYILPYRGCLSTVKTVFYRFSARTFAKNFAVTEPETRLTISGVPFATT
jgi:hypothetical protein